MRAACILSCSSSAGESRPARRDQRIETLAIPGNQTLVIMLQERDLEPCIREHVLQLQQRYCRHGVMVCPVFNPVCNRFTGYAKQQIKCLPLPAVAPARLKAQPHIPINHTGDSAALIADAADVDRVEEEQSTGFERVPGPLQSLLQRRSGMAVVDRIEEAGDEIELGCLVEGSQIAEQKPRCRAPRLGQLEHRGAVVQASARKSSLQHVQQMLAGAAGQVQIVPPAGHRKTLKRALGKCTLLRVVHFGAELVVIAGKVGVEISVISHGSDQAGCAHARERQVRFQATRKQQARQGF